MDTRFVESRLDLHEEHIQRLQSDVAELKLSLQNLDADRVDFAEFRKVLMGWMKEHGKYHDSDFSGGRGSGFFFASDGGNGDGDTVRKSDFNSGRDVFGGGSGLIVESGGNSIFDSGIDSTFVSGKRGSGGILESGGGAMPHSGTNPSEDVEVAVVEFEEPVPEVLEEVQASKSSHLIVDFNTHIEETPKKSYASIVMDIKHICVELTFPAPSPQPKNKESDFRSAYKLFEESLRLNLSSTTAYAAFFGVFHVVWGLKHRKPPDHLMFDGVPLYVGQIHERVYKSLIQAVRKLWMIPWRESTNKDDTSKLVGNDECEEGNGDYCGFEELMYRELPPPEPPDPRSNMYFVGHKS